MKYIWILLFLIFPLQVFVQDVSNNPEFVLPTCPTSLSCKGRCSSKEDLENATRFAPHCHCDPHCKRYRDCCADYHQFCANKTSSSSFAVPDNSDQMACVMTEGNTKGVWMVAKCPKDSLSDDDTKRKCLDGSKQNRTLTYHTFSEDVPVMDMLFGVHYRNKFCALCNGVDPLLFKVWKLRIRCNIKPPAGLSFIEQINFLLKYCPTRYREIDDDLLRRFCYNITSTCPAGGTSTHAQRTKCEQGPTQLVTKMQGQIPITNFRNMDCLLCNGHQSKNAACGPRDTIGNIFNPKSFEVLISTAKKELEFQQTCRRNFVYDKYLQICRSKSHKMDPVKAVSDKYRFKVWLSPSNDEQLKIFTKDMFVYAFTQVINVISSQIVVVNFGKEDKAMAVTFDVHSVDSKATNTIDTNNIISNKTEIQELLKPNATFSLTINRRYWTVLKLTWRQLSCVKMDTYLPGEFILFPLNNSMLINKTREILPATAFYLKDGEDKLYDSRIAYVCRSSFTTFCPYHFVSIRQEDYTILANGSLYHPRTGTLFLSGEYYIEEGFGVVCTNDTNRFVIAHLMQRRTDNVALRYMTLIGLSVSVFSLLLVLFTHILLPELRNPLPGKNLMNLSLSLLLAHFLFLLGSGATDKPTFCKMTAIALHWLFLVSFACMAVIAHDTRATFSRKMSNIQGVSIGHSHTPRFLINTAVAWGLPLFLVAVCALLEEIKVFDIGYGGQVACWVAGDGKESQRNVQLVIFAAPVALVLIYNVFAFSQTIMAITVARQQSQRLNKAGHNNPNMVKIYIRLLSLMGFSWFFGFSAPYIHEALMYPFVFFSTLQGLYIFIAFVCKSRVWRMYKVTFSRTSLKTPRSTTYTTSTRADSGGMRSTKLEELSIDDTNM